MSLDMAALYLSVDHSTFRRLALDHSIDAIDVGLEAPRWRKVDLDRLTRRLPTIPSLPDIARADRRLMSDADIDTLATAVAKRVATNEPRGTPELFSIKDAGRLLGLGQSTVYRLISERQLEVRRIGRRTLITKATIERLQDGVAR